MPRKNRKSKFKTKPDPWSSRFDNTEYICCADWDTCWENSECISTQITWESVREGLYQRNPLPGKLVTLDCYFVPPNILEIGLIVKINRDLIYIYCWSGHLIIRELEKVFIFPDTYLLHSFEVNIKRKFKRSVWARRLREN